VLVAVDDVQTLAAHERQQLAHRSLACACFAHKQHRLLVPQTPAGHTHAATSARALLTRHVNKRELTVPQHLLSRKHPRHPQTFNALVHCSHTLTAKNQATKKPASHTN
jgi:hypothetical protein